MTLPEPDLLQIKLMFAEAGRRHCAATLLANVPADTSDSAYLLELLALELLLKAAVRLHTRQAATGHDYGALFGHLPSSIQTELLAKAGGRMSTGATYQNVSELFAAWSKNFIALRYPYEKYQGLTEDQYRARGDAWLAAGADPAAADFTYHPEELNGLVWALGEHVKAAVGRLA